MAEVETMAYGIKRLRGTMNERDKMIDPTYEMDRITGHTVWHIAFLLSEQWQEETMKHLLILAALVALTLTPLAAQTTAAVTDDTDAWQNVLVMGCDQPTDKPSDAPARAAYRQQRLKFDPTQEKMLARFCADHFRVLNAHNQQVDAENKAGTWRGEVEQREFDLVRRGMIGAIKSDFRNANVLTYGKLDETVQREKANMVFIPDEHSPMMHDMSYYGGAKLVEVSFSDTMYTAGYTAYATLWLGYGTVAPCNGVCGYSGVQVSGSSTSMGCSWDNYHGQWQPPGCPATHVGYIDNEVDTYGGITSGSSAPYNGYLTYGNTVSFPYRDGDNNRKIKQAPAIWCSVARAFLITFLFPPTDTDIAFTKVKSLAPPASGSCTVQYWCSNPPPYALPVTAVIVGNVPSCPQYFNCVALGEKRGGIWYWPPAYDVCPSTDDPLAKLCTPMH